MNIKQILVSTMENLVNQIYGKVLLVFYLIPALSMCILGFLWLRVVIF